jgi:hypothetical protein
MLDMGARTASDFSEASDHSASASLSTIESVAAKVIGVCEEPFGKTFIGRVE